MRRFNVREWWLKKKWQAFVATALLAAPCMVALGQGEAVPPTEGTQPPAAKTAPAPARGCYRDGQINPYDFNAQDLGNGAGSGGGAGMNGGANNAAPSRLLSSSSQASGALLRAPNMIGDFFGTGSSSSSSSSSSVMSIIGFDPLGEPILSNLPFGAGPGPGPSSPSPLSQLFIPGGNIGAAPGAQIGRLKLTENTSPIPQDRVFVNYSYFDDTPLFPGGVNVNRVAPGFEKTFLDGNV